MESTFVCVPDVCDYDGEPLYCGDYVAVWGVEKFNHHPSVIWVITALGWNIVEIERLYCRSWKDRVHPSDVQFSHRPVNFPECYDEPLLDLSDLPRYLKPRAGMREAE